MRREISARMLVTAAAVAVLAVSPWSTARSEGIPTDYVAYYPFSSDANDASGNGYHGQTYGGIALAEDRFGQPCSAYFFDGLSGVIDVPVPKTGGDFSISFFLCVEEIVHPGHFVMSDGRPGEGNTVDPWVWIFLPGFGEDVRRALWNWEDTNAGNHPYLASETAFPNEIWYHVVVVREGADKRIYVDGAFEGQQHDSSTPNYLNPHPITIGNAPDHPGTDRHFYGALDDFRFYHRALTPSEILLLYHEGGWREYFTVAGTTTSPSGGLCAVPVELVDAVGDPVAATATDECGAYVFEEVPNGDYTVSIVTPLGYTADDESKEITVAGDDVVCDFYLEPVQTVADPRSAGFWKHQLKVYLTGHGNAQIPMGDFLNYLALIGQHFNNNPVNPVTLYTVEPGATWLDSLEVACTLLETRGKAPMSHLAGRQLMALLLNVTSDMLTQFTLVSADGATASQAITYCWMLIDDGIPLNDETAKDIGDQINNGILVAPGVIPGDTEDISYGQPGGDAVAVPAAFVLHQNHPNPAQPVTTIRYGLPEGCRVVLTVHNLLGETIAELVNEQKGAGYHTVALDAAGWSAGVYFYRLDAGDWSATRTLTVVK